MRVHFRTKKRRAKNIANKLEERVLKERRVRSRKNGKRLKRCIALKQSSTIAEPDKARYLLCMKNEFMSSEESMTDDSDNSDQGDSDSDVDAPKPRVLCIRPLPWRSRELNNLMSSLDRKVTRRRTQRSASMTLRRRLGANSTRPAPENAPEFALS
ncbi:uncharacterized protein [Montipora foliosa]|uniref:uncharacterized protein n=1 Tax=Montipora foliosa TaxID=591990 RepID=UPI0035F1C1A8